MKVFEFIVNINQNYNYILYYVPIYLDNLLNNLFQTNSNFLTANYC